MLTFLGELANMVEDLGLGARNAVCDFGRSVEEAMNDKNGTSEMEGTPVDISIDIACDIVAMEMCKITSVPALEEMLSRFNIVTQIETIKAKSGNRWKETLSDAILRSNNFLSRSDVNGAINKICCTNSESEKQLGSGQESEKNNLDIGIEMIAESNPKLGEAMRKAVAGEISEEGLMDEIKRNGKITFDIAALLNREPVKAAVSEKGGKATQNKKPQPHRKDAAEEKKADQKQSRPDGKNPEYGNSNPTKETTSDQQGSNTEPEHPAKKNLSIVEALQTAKVGEKLKLFDKVSEGETMPAANPA